MVGRAVPLCMFLYSATLAGAMFAGATLAGAMFAVAASAVPSTALAQASASSRQSSAASVTNAAGESQGDNLQGEKPKVEFTQLRHDFGEIMRGQRVSYAFEFVNAGSGVLQIRSIHAACGCAQTRVEPKSDFRPGEKGRIAFEFDSSLFAGSLVRTLTVDTNAPMPSTVTLTFTADIKQEISAQPALLSVGEVNREFSKSFFLALPTHERAKGADTLPIQFDTVSLPGEVRNALLVPQGELKPLHVTTSSNAVSASLVQETGKEPRLKVTFNGNLPIGPLRERVTVWNNSRHLKELVVPVIGEVVGHVKPSAKYVEFGVVPRSKTVRRSLTLKSDLKDFRVEDVEVELRKTELLSGVKPSDLVHYSTERASSGVTVHFDLRYPEALKDAAELPVNASGFFVLRTSDPDYKEIRIPFFGVLRQELKR